MNIKNKPEHGRSSLQEEAEPFSSRLNVSIKGESLRSFARRSGLSETVMRKYVGGKSTPNVERLIAMAKALGVSVSWLATGIDEGDIGLAYQAKESTEIEENQNLQEDQWQKQQEKFKKGSQLMFEMAENDPNYNPDGIWSALLVELLAMHGLAESGYQRILETLKMLEQRDENKREDT